MASGLDLLQPQRNRRLSSFLTVSLIVAEWVRRASSLWLSSVESVGHALRPASSQPPPPPLHPPPIQNIGFNDGFNGHHDGSHANGYNGYSDSYQYPHQQKSRSESGSGGNRGNNGQIRQGENGAGRDALSHEVDQRPNVRGSLSKAMSPTSHQSSSTEGGARRVARTSHPNRSDYDGHGRKIVRYPDDGSDARTSPDEHDAFYASLRGGGARGGSVRRGSGGGGRGCAGKKQAVRRPEWNSDTATVDFLGDPRTVHVTDNSPLAIQVTRLSKLSFLDDLRASLLRATRA